MDDLLKIYARQRRDAAGTPELHPVNRRFLQEEVAKLRPTGAPTPKPRRWFHSFLTSWPQLTAAASIVLVLGVGLDILRRSQQDDGLAERFALSSSSGSESESLGRYNRPLPPQEPQRAAQDKDAAARTFTETRSAAANSISADSASLSKAKENSVTQPSQRADSLELKQGLADASTPLQLGRDETADTKKFAVAPQSPPPATLPLPSAPVARHLQATSPTSQSTPGSAPTALAETDSFSGLAQDGAFPRPAAKPDSIDGPTLVNGPAPASRNVQLTKQETPAAGAAGAVAESLASERQTFRRLSDLSSARGAVNQQPRYYSATDRLTTGQAQPQPSPGDVLGAFELVQTGDRLQVIDADGSQYVGGFEAPTSVVGGKLARQPAPTKSLVILPAPTSSPAGTTSSVSRRFRLVGTNQTLKQMVVFEGSLGDATISNQSPAQAQLSSSAAAAKSLTDTGFVLTPPLALPIQGTLRIGTSNAVLFRALPVSR